MTPAKAGGMEWVCYCGPCSHSGTRRNTEERGSTIEKGCLVMTVEKLGTPETGWKDQVYFRHGYWSRDEPGSPRKIKTCFKWHLRESEENHVPMCTHTGKTNREAW